MNNKKISNEYKAAMVKEIADVIRARHTIGMPEEMLCNILDGAVKLIEAETEVEFDSALNRAKLLADIATGNVTKG